MWQGVAVAVGVSVAVGVIVHITIGNLEGDARLRTFAAISALAAVVLTWMIFWMKRQSRRIRGDLEHKVDVALQARNIRRAIAGVALIAVLREGIEAALFLIAAGTDEDGTQILLGAIIGLALASLLAYLVYWGGRSMPIEAFFTVTGLVLIVFATGLVARTVLFLQVSGDLGSFDLTGVYDLTGYRGLTQQSEVGKFLAAMFGWDPRPSLEQVVCLAGLHRAGHVAVQAADHFAATPAGRGGRRLRSAAVVPGDGRSLWPWPAAWRSSSPTSLGPS